MRQICGICDSAYVHAKGRCAACRKYFLNHGKERPWWLIVRSHAHRSERLEALAHLRKQGYVDQTARRLLRVGLA